LTLGERKRLSGLQRRQARQVAFAKKHNGGRYSNRLRKTIRQIAELRARQARRRLNFTHQLTTDLAKNHGWIGIEDLSVAGMTRKPQPKPDPAQPGVFLPNGRRAKAGLNRSILDNAWGERRRLLAYKALRFGSELRTGPAGLAARTARAGTWRCPVPGKPGGGCVNPWPVPHDTRRNRRSSGRRGCQSSTCPVTQVIVPPPTQIAPASSVEMCTRPWRPSTVPWLAT
jgi:hypothetical protein